MAILGVQKTLELGRALGKVLGLEGSWNKIVLEIEVGKIAKIYVRGFITPGASDDIVQAVKDVMVADDCEVTVVPNSEG